MWKCPKCQRAFKKEGQSHYCGKAPSTIQEYIASQDEDIRENLLQVYQAIHEVLSEAEEKISWSMPTWYDKYNIIHFAANRKHIGLYPGPEAVEHFADQLNANKLSYSKGSIRIPYSDHLPLELVKEIAEWCKTTGNHA